MAGGVDSYWAMCCKNKILKLEFTISGNGQDAKLVTQIPGDLVLDQLNYLIDLRKHIEKKEKYTNIDVSVQIESERRT